MGLKATTEPDESTRKILTPEAMGWATVDPGAKNDSSPPMVSATRSPEPSSANCE
jgi:hypothetical protein